MHDDRVNVSTIGLLALVLAIGGCGQLTPEPKKARERADVVLVSAPTNPDGVILKGQSLIEEREYEKGIAELKRAIALNPKNIRVYLSLASAFMQRQDPQSAEATFQQAIA